MSDEKKIIVDEDWKSQVAAERQQQQAEPAASDAQVGDAGPHGFPPASFEMLLTTLATEAMMALGQLPNPLTETAEVHEPQAKYIIDTLGVLEEKTKGNLSEQEETMLRELLHQLRMVFVAVQGQAAPPATDAE